MNAPIHTYKTVTPTRNGVIAMLWTVYGFRQGMRENVASFFNYGDAVSFVGASERNLYIAEPRYDERLSGWALAENSALRDPMGRRG